MVQAPNYTTTKELAILAVDLIRQTGCEYGDIRICHYRNSRGDNKLKGMRE